MYVHVFTTARACIHAEHVCVGVGVCVSVRACVEEGGGGRACECACARAFLSSQLSSAQCTLSIIHAALINPGHVRR